VNWHHLLAFLWLRWRLRVNQVKKAGVFNAIVTAIFAVSLIPAALGAFVAAFLAGLLAVPLVPEEYLATVILFVWDGAIVAFLFVWAVGVLAELQRSDALSLDKLLHLPVSLTGAFLINYVSSLFSVNLLIFVPPMVGFSLGLAGSQGPALLLLLPLLAAFLLAVTAATYQFQGWLASLMVNKRRRQTIIVLLTLGFLVITQVPNLANMMRLWGSQPTQNPVDHRNGEWVALDAALHAGKLTPQEYRDAQAKLMKQLQEQVKEQEREQWAAAVSIGRLVNMVLPPGWLALGGMDLVSGQVLSAILGSVGLTLIGSACLWRAYRTTMRLYTGQFTAGTPKPAAAPTAPKPKVADGALFVESELPWVPEQAAAIAVSGFRSLLRAPESKMLLLTPIVMLVAFGGALLANHGDVPEPVRFLIVVGAMGMILTSILQFIGNQFGFDRGGFRVFVLSPARRQDILLGKNLPVAPLALGMGLVMAILVEIVYPMGPDYFLASLVHIVAMFFLFCTLANWMSILAPIAINPGTMKMANPSAVPVLLVFLFMFVMMLAFLPTLLPVGIAVLLYWWGCPEWVPLCLPLTLLMCVTVLFLYRLALPWQGRMLQAREQKILMVVTTKAN
jgi:ABC-2 type transport system permease protein